MKKLFYKMGFWALLLLAGQAVFAQNAKPSIGILKLDAQDLPAHKAVKINKCVESAFYNSNRFDIVTRQLRASIDQERELQKSNPDNIAILQGKAVGADYIIRGKAREYRQQIYKSSPQSRAPVRTSQRSSSRTSPRSSSTETKGKTKQKTEKTSPIVYTNTPKNTSELKTDSPRSSSSKQISKIPNTGPKTSTSKTRKVPKTQKTATLPLRNSPEKEESKTSEAAKKNQNAPLSAEIDRIYTSTRISFTIELIDVKTGVIIKEDTYDGSINRINYFVQNFVKKAFPFEFQILEVLEMKGDKKAKNLLVYGGEKQGLRAGTYLRVFEVSEENVDGRILKREVQIGKLFVMKLDTGGNFSLCRITKGKKTILEKLNQNVRMVCR